MSLSVDATSGAELAWSFSFGGSPTRWVSSQQFQTLDADIAADVAVFRTTFDDQVASVSGGKPDTAGTVTITCT